MCRCVCKVEHLCKGGTGVEGGHCDGLGGHWDELGGTGLDWGGHWHGGGAMGWRGDTGMDWEFIGVFTTRV